MNIQMTDANRFDFWYAIDVVERIQEVAEAAATMGLDAATVDEVVTLFAAAFGLAVTR